MNWDKLYLMQKDLDQYIEENHQLADINVVDEKLLALLVELGELANETRCFKFWSTKPPSEKQVIIEEYVDGLHFLLSLGLDLDYRYSPQPVSDFDTQTEAFLQMYSDIEQLRKDRSEKSYTNAFHSYLSLGQTLGFNETELMDAYHSKNNVNYERQDQGY
ncbi:dUTP diphosphatase [Halobacillus sp. BBL2006]|uniref:dUTP diphosphatase n=1 Tax=Halobacillus sp. BBL2006 TaxID=1543706 RepID=UPI0005424341|nr:dUTP diphosphatase [Halobacillus sp. BBL2006]KHE66996.1 dUTPase [Halobacillus sp. BBL2006]